MRRRPQTTADRARSTPSARQALAARRGLFEALEQRVLLAVNAIVAENQLPGTPGSTWDVSGSGDAALQGFPTDISVNVGATESFKITDTANALYHIDIYRMGYYQGNGARLIATIPSSQTIRKSQPAPLKDTTTGLVDCGNWSITASWTVPSTAVSGIYFARLVREDTGGASRVVFVVRNDASHSDLLFQTSDTTWQAYNTYGGNSLYQGTATIFTGQSDPGRAAKVSYNRPLTIDGVSGGYGTYNSPFHGEYPMVRWLEQNGYDVTYFTDVDSDRNGALIKNHKTFLSVGHDEYWSGGQRNNVEAARDAGVNLAFFSGNESFWKTRWETSIDGSGTPFRTLVCYKESKTGVKQDPSGIWTGTWRDTRLSPPYDGGRPENAMSGTLYMNDRTSTDLGVPMQVPAADGKLRFWRNTSVANLANGATATLGNFVVGYETDEDLDNGFRPAGLIDMSATSFTTSSHVISAWGTDVGTGSSVHKITLYRAASGALVFGAGSVQWSWGLDGNHLDGSSTPSVPMEQATVNLFADMGVQPASLMSGLVAATASTDAAAPTSTITAPTPGTTYNEGATVTITGTTTDSGGVVAGVEVSVDGGVTWHPATGRGTWAYTWLPNAAGTANIRVRAADDSGNLENPGAGINVTVLRPTPVLAMGFEEGTGTTTADSSGSGNNGTLANAVWSTTGKFGKALSFNGTNAWVTVADAASLDLTTGMTLEAWVKPASLSGWTAVAIKERGTGALSYSLYNSDNTNRPPAAYVNTGSADVAAAGASVLPLNAWSHIAGTYDGSNLRLYVNGTLVSTTANSGPIVTSTGVLRIGGDAMWGEYFSGLIDELRVYKVALGPADLQADMNTAVVPTGPVDTTAPTVSLTNPANNATLSGTVTVSANAADNVGVAGVQFLLNGNPLGAEDTTAPYSISWDTTTVANGAYVLTARARDAAGNVTTSSAINVTVNQPDLTAPTVTSRTPAANATNVPLNTAPTATFSETLQSGTIQFTLKDAANNAVPATLSYNATTRVATLTPTSALAAGTTYTATVSGAADTAGNVMTATSWSFTTVAADTTAPTVTAKTPAAGATGVATGAVATVIFSESIQPGTLSFVLKDASNNTVAAAITYDDATHTATLDPTAALANSATYTVTVTGAKDLAGNTMAGSIQWSFTTAAAPVGPFSVFSSTTIPVTAADPDTSATELGMKFRTDVAGTITGVRFYKASTNTGVHVGNLWSSTGTLLATITFANESASGWQQALFSTPVAISANTTYVISYHTNVGHYAGDSGFFTSTGVDNGPLHALASGVDGPNGVYIYGATSIFPTNAFGDTNYYVDVVFNTDNTAPTVSATNPVNNATNVALSVVPTATFSESVQASTISFILKDSGGATVAATASYNAATNTVSLTPTAPLAGSTTYTATVSGAADTAGNVMTAPVTWSFTTAAADTTAPTVTAKTPAAGATNVPTTTTATVIFSESIQPGTLSFVLKDASNNTVAATVAYNDTTRTATLTPTVSLANSTTYTVTVTGAKDLAGNTMAGAVQWSFTTAAAPAIGAGPFSLWTDSTVPGVSADPDTGSVELGMKFRTDVDGVITGVRFYKASTNTGTHTGTLWSSTGTLLATVTFTNESASGWQQAYFSTPVAVTANTTYVISYHAPGGHYSTSNAYFSATGTDNGPLHALASGVDGLNGVYSYAATTAFPASSYQDTNYWVDVVFARNANVQTTTGQFNTGTTSNVTVSTSGDGALQLAGGFRDDFTGTSLNAANWTTTSWTGAGGGTTAVSVASGVLNIRGAEILSTQLVPALAPVEGRVTIAAATNRNFGLATDLATAAGNYWAVFTTAATTNSLYARVNNNGTVTDVRISALPSGYHVYRVTPTATGFQFYVDGALKTTINQTFPTGTPLRMVMSAFTGSPDPIMKVDYIQLLSNASSGTFTSAVLDAGRTASWGNVNWDASLPAGTTMTIQVRGGNSATPDGTWSNWSTVTDGGAIGLPSSRYLQYQIVFTTTDTTVSPTLYDISFTWV